MQWLDLKTTFPPVPTSSADENEDEEKDILIQRSASGPFC